MHNPALSAGKRLVIYCASGGRSALATKTLQDMGYAEVANLTGAFRPGPRPAARPNSGARRGRIMAQGGAEAPLDTAFAPRALPRACRPVGAVRERGRHPRRDTGARAHSHLHDRVSGAAGRCLPRLGPRREMISESHRAMAAMINAEPEEVMIGPSTSMNVFLLAQALRPGLREGTRSLLPISIMRRMSAHGASSQPMGSPCASGASMRKP